MNKKYLTIPITMILSLAIGSTMLTAKPAVISNTEEGVLALATNENTEVAQKESASAEKTENTAVTKQAEQPLTSQPQVVQTSPTRKTTVTSGTSTINSRQAKTNAIISTAKQYIGIKYLWGGTTPAGFDCSGYTSYVFAKNGITLPRISRDQYAVGKSVSFANLQAGDLVFFSLQNNGVIDHVGIYVGNGQFINSSSSKGVTIYPLSNYWQTHYMGAKRVY